MKAHGDSRPRGGFTLVEILMVVVIILIASAVAVPSLMRSFRGAKLRASARQQVMTSRYARSIAVLQQVQTALLLDTALNTMEVLTISMPPRSTSIFLNDVAGHGGEEAGTPVIESVLVRRLESGVRFIDVRGDGRRELPENDGIYTIRFFSNGMCDPYEVILEDDLGKRARISVDPLSGKSKTENIN